VVGVDSTCLGVGLRLVLLYGGACGRWAHGVAAMGAFPVQLLLALFRLGVVELLEALIRPALLILQKTVFAPPLVGS
jgi:hypothetical protein